MLTLGDSPIPNALVVSCRQSLCDSVAVASNLRLYIMESSGHTNLGQRQLSETEAATLQVNKGQEEGKPSSLT